MLSQMRNVERKGCKWTVQKQQTHEAKRLLMYTARKVRRHQDIVTAENQLPRTLADHQVNGNEHEVRWHNNNLSPEE